MADPHNPDRYGETWPQHRLDAYMEVLQEIHPFVVFSGGWAWHLLSPEGHTEYKHAHDHKDVDLMVPPTMVGTVVAMLKNLGFEKVGTRYDRLPSEEDFRRYEKVVEVEPHPAFRITIDFFVKKVPILKVRDEWAVVRPDVLLTYYSTIHSSKSCWAVLAATELFKNGAKPEDLIGDPSLTACAELDCWFCRKCGWNGQFPTPFGRNMMCGGCERYMVTNLGKPTFRPRPEQMEKAAKMMKEMLS
jgi:hypothetical protein